MRELLASGLSAAEAARLAREAEPAGPARVGVEEFAATLRAALAPDPPPRRPTRPTAGSRARRLDQKARRGAVKRLRGRPSD
jgi:hypothetical protein